MRGGSRRNSKNSEATAQAEVSAWLEAVSAQLDDQLASHSVERGLSLYQTTDLTIGDIERPSLKRAAT